MSAEKKRAAVKKLFALYNEQGLTSIGDRNASRGDLDLYLSLEKANELTVRVNVARSFNPSGSREEIARRFDSLPGKDGRGGPTGTGDDWVRIGPIKLFLDGGMLNGSAYMRKPWPRGETYQITQDDYRGLLFIQPEQLKVICEEAAKRKWAITAHTAGEGAMDVLLDAYEFTNRVTPIKDLRFCITHANFPSQFNLERCQEARRLRGCAARLALQGRQHAPEGARPRADALVPAVQVLARIHHDRRRQRSHAPLRSTRKHQPLEPVAGHLGRPDAQARTRRRPRTDRGAHARTSPAALHRSTMPI